MKFEKLYIIIILFTSLNCLYGQNLELILESYKTEFLKYEPIGISLFLKNNALETVQISGIREQYEFGYMMHIYNSNRDTLNSESGILSNIPTAIYTLMPGEEVQFNINLLWYCKYEDSNERVTRFGYYFNTGELFINCTLDFDAASILTKRTNKNFKSNTIKINILEPTKEDRKGIIADLKEVSRLNKYYEGEQFTESIKKALEIIDKYQDHPLTQLVFSYLSPRAQRFYYFDKDYYYKKLAKNHPYSITGIAEAAKYIDEDEEFKNEIKGTELYKNAMEYKRQFDKKLEIIERLPYNPNYRSKKDEK